MEPEQLKKLAEYMGHFPYSIPRDNLVYYDKFDSDGSNIYNPLKNADQCLELMEMLLNSGHSICKLGNFYHVEFWTDEDTDDRRECVFNISGKTLSEAVTLAAIAYIEGK